MRAGIIGLCVALSTGAAVAQQTVTDPAPLPPASPSLTRTPDAGASERTRVAAPGVAATERAEMQELVELTRAIAKSSREEVSYSRVMPDILTQILVKLDKLEDKLDKIETKLPGPPRKGR